ncbi:flagellar hook-length control protein FliK [Brenneria populi]|uniref:Flagellar hook-length control protein FliK n=1 Tax=Brenneria populi TaxID=1505588 RepID=A0ABU6JVP2_9GAMM|nr:flagellar hook-length control protein FliK [Brenneria populi Li et al. 2015]
MNLSSVSNVVINNNTSTASSSARQSESGGAFEQMLSARQDAAPSTETASAGDGATRPADNQESAESASADGDAAAQETAKNASAQPSPKEPPADKTAAVPDNADTADSTAEIDAAATDPTAEYAGLKNTPAADKEKNIAPKEDIQAAPEDLAGPVDSAVLPSAQETTDHQDESDISDYAPDAATQSLLAMLNQAQTIKADAASDAVSRAPDNALTPTPSAAAALTLAAEPAATDAAAQSDSPLTAIAADDDGRQLNRADASTGKKIEFVVDDGADGDSAAGNSAIATAAARNIESAAANSANNASPSIAAPSHALSAAAQTATQQAAGAVTTSSAMLNAQVGSEGWQQSLGQQIVMFARDGQQNAKLRLHPEELGSLQINLTLNNDNEAQIHFVSAHSQVRAALEAALPHLRTSLAENGIDLGQASVGGESSQSWTEERQTSDSGIAQASEGMSADGLTTTLNVPTSLQQMASDITGINIFA